jgi:hypothetical protein
MAQQSLAPPGSVGGGYRPNTPSDRIGTVSDVIESQIMNGGGMRNMNGRGGWRDSDLPGDATPGPMRTPSLSQMSDAGSIRASNVHGSGYGQGQGHLLDVHGQEASEVVGERAPQRVPSPLRGGSS